MLQLHALKLYVATARLGGQLAFLQNSRAYSSRPSWDEEEFKAAREWFSKFTRNSLPEKLAKTSYVRSSGPGGQKTNKTSSKATTTWDMKTLQAHVPKALHPGLRGSNYYVMSSDSIRIDSDIYRSQSENKEETHQRLNEIIRSIYRSIVPGTTSEKQKMKVDALLSRPRDLQQFFTQNKMDGNASKKFLNACARDKSIKKKQVIKDNNEKAKASRLASRGKK